MYYESFFFFLCDGMKVKDLLQKKQTLQIRVYFFKSHNCLVMVFSLG